MRGSVRVQIAPGEAACDVAPLALPVVHEPVDAPRWAAWIFVALAGSLLAILLAGCAPARETKDLISTGAAVVDGDLREWDSLTDEQKKRAHWKVGRALHVVDADVNGVELAPQWQEKEPPK